MIFFFGFGFRWWMRRRDWFEGNDFAGSASAAVPVGSAEGFEGMAEADV